MTVTEKRLLMLLGIAVGVWTVFTFGFPARETATASLTELQASKHDKTLELQQLHKHRSQLSPRLQRALTNDIPLASTLCQTWLLELSQECGLQAVSVAPFPVRQEVGALQVLPISLNGAASQLQVLEFLQRVTQSAVEHRIKHWTLEPKADRTLQLALQIEVLCTPQGQRHPIAMPPYQRQDDWLTLQQKLQMQTPLVTTPMPQVASTAPRQPPAPRRQYQLVGIIAATVRPEALFIEQTSRREIKRTRGETLEENNSSGTIASIQPRSITLKTAMGTQEIQVGELITLAAPTPP